MTAARTYLTESGQTVSEVPGQPGRVITGRSELLPHNPTSVDPFALIPGCGEDEECLDCPDGMPCYCTAESSDADWDRER